MRKTFLGNYTCIPTSKKWVFHSIFRLVFVELYGKKVCSLNKLVLTDKEDAEYRSFESMIATQDFFKNSKVMLCIFHPIWQPFKRDVSSLLPRKSAQGKPIELTELGNSWGKYLF
jgi:hypothetical protein